MNTSGRLKIIEFKISGLWAFSPRIFSDDRGYFFELWNKNTYKDLGLDVNFVQDNVSFSKHGVLRGLHFQNPQPQGKLITVLDGEIFDVAVDLRASSPTFGMWESIIISSQNRIQFYVPPGFAHGFLVLSNHALVHYKCTDFYCPAAETTLLWDDPDVAINWPLNNPILSKKDLEGSRLKDLPKSKLFE